MTYINKLKCAVSAVASAGLGAFTVSTAISPNRTFGSGQDGQSFACHISEGSIWEIRTGCVYTHSGTSLSRGTLEDSSTGSAITFTSAAVIRVVLTAGQLTEIPASFDLSYAAAVPLTRLGTGYMPSQTVSAPIAFTVSGSPVKGAHVYLRLLADGTNTPTFAGMLEWGGSMGYDNRAGITNEITFFYDGVDVWYSIMQAVGAVPIDLTAPTLSSAVVSASTPGRIDLTWSEAMNSTMSAYSAFAVSAGHTLTAHTYVDSTHSYLTTSTDFTSGESRTLAYTQPGSNKMQDTAGNLLASFSGTAITNNVGYLAIRAGSLANLTESGDGTVGWSYLGSGAWATAYGLLDHKLPASTDGWIEGEIDFTPSGYTKAVAMWLKSANTASDYTASLYGYYAHQDYGFLASGSFDAADLGNPTLGDIVRIGRTGTTVYVNVNGSQIKQWTGTTVSSDLYFNISADGAGKLKNLRGSGVT